MRLIDIGSKKEYLNLFYKIMDTLIQNCINGFSDVKYLEFLSLLEVNDFKDSTNSVLILRRNFMGNF